MISQTDQWLDIDLHQLAAFQAIASEGSFHGAAAALGYTQSAISQQVAALERIVGETLIHRPGGPRAVSLTEPGQLMLRHVETILARLHAAQADLSTLSAGVTGAVRVGTYQSVGRTIVPRLMREFANSWPNVEIRLTESTNDTELLPAIEHGELDLTFAILPLPDGPFEAIDILEDPYVLIVPRDSPYARNGKLADLTVFRDSPLIGFRQCRSVAQIEDSLRERGIQPRIVFRSDDNGTVQGMVAAGVGNALVPRLTIESSHENIAIVDLAGLVPPRRVALVWHRDRYQSIAARAFVAAAKRIAGEFATVPREAAVSR
jgi:DNA-binding transcriptional LysR family regulator